MRNQKRPVDELTPAEKRAKERYERGLKALGVVLSEPVGREALRFLLIESNLFAEKLWAPGAEIHANVAVRDYGARMQREMQRANGAAYVKLYQEQLHDEAVEEVARRNEEEIA